MRLAILGGSFNPVHLGHLALAESVVTSCGYDRLLLVPSFKAPHKNKVKGASAEDRLALLLAAVEGDRRIAVDDCELRRGGISYTIDTVLDIERRYQCEGNIGLVLGDDLASGFSSWMRAEELAGRTDIILARRVQGGNVAFPFQHRDLDNPYFELSSSELRKRIALGGSWRYLVSDGVRRIIEERGLYGLPPGERRSTPPSSLLLDVERVARLELSSSRYLHSRGVALLAADLCARFGIDSDRGYLAGIVHDLCKELPSEKVRALALRDGFEISLLEESKPSLLHSRAAAVVLKERFSVEDADVLEAIRLHTSGAPGMAPLAKIVYIADKIEPSRQDVDPALRLLARNADIETLFGSVLRSTVLYLRAKGRVLSDETQRLLAALDEGLKR